MNRNYIVLRPPRLSSVDSKQFSFGEAAMILFRPTGLRELELVAASGWKAWPPRLPDQPIFYPVLTHEYARKIARDWNSNDQFSGFVGFVTQFELNEDFARRYAVQIAGGRSHEELWVPSDELAEFNRHIVGRIVVVEAFPGSSYTGQIAPATNLPVGLPLVLGGSA